MIFFGPDTEYHAPKVRARSVSAGELLLKQQRLPPLAEWVHNEGAWDVLLQDDD